MKKYIYRDNRQMPPVVIFECESENILEADALYRASMKNEPIKQPYVGCEIVCETKEVG